MQEPFAKNFIRFFKKLDQGIDLFSRYGVVVCVGGMLFFSLATIVCRWLNVTVLWFDPLIKHLVFLSTFLGGSLAIGRRQHIGIDLLSSKKKPARLIYFVSFFTLCWLIQSSIHFVKDTFQYEGIVFLQIHRGYLTSIIPFGFFLMAIRCFYGLLDPQGHQQTGLE